MNVRFSLVALTAMIAFGGAAFAQPLPSTPRSDPATAPKSAPNAPLPSVPGTSSAATNYAGPIGLLVDAREAPRNLLHATMSIPVVPGPFTFVYPQWIPGEHMPSGPIQNIASVVVRAGTVTIPWQRDLVDLYAFHVVVPPTASRLDISLDFVLGSGGSFSSGVSSTANLLDLSWNQLVFYPQGARPRNVHVFPSVILPAGWQFGTALPSPRRTGVRVDFAPVSLETLVDSPLDAGRYFRKVTLLDTAGSSNEIDAVADSTAALAFSDATIATQRNLVREADALYGARHWQHYHFLLTLSDTVASFGLEHHQSSDDRLGERYFIDRQLVQLGASLLPHEFTHSWNGKYRRPAGLATDDYQKPMDGELLWVYEGLTNYLGEVLSFRDGGRKLSDFPDLLAETAATLDATPGRLTRSLDDTAVAAQLLYEAPRTFEAERRGTDFYSEGTLLWLEADTIIRQRSDGLRSLDDFAHRFLGGRNTPPMVVPYTRADVIAALQTVQPYDWAGFFAERVDRITPHPPMGGIDRAGWRLVYTDTPSRWMKLRLDQNHGVQTRFSLGAVIDRDGRISDVLDGSPAAAGGLGIGDRILAINDRRWSVDALNDALIGGKTAREPLTMLVDDLGVVSTKSITYHGGPRYPHLVRVAGRADILARIAAPHARR